MQRFCILDLAYGQLIASCVYLRVKPVFCALASFNISKPSDLKFRMKGCLEAGMIKQEKKQYVSVQVVTC